ncbi:MULTISPECIES: hypothetical protein [unclassified Agrobacterium]
MTNSFVAYLQSKGFSHVSFDMSKTVTITAWRRTERKTYSVYQAASLEDAEAKLLAMINAPAAEPKKPEPDFADVLG